MDRSSPYRFALIGAGWRAEFFLRIVAALPERFHLAGLIVRNADKGALVEQRWGHRTFRSVAALLDTIDTPPEFLVSSVSYAANGEVNLGLLEIDLPILSETPPAASLEQMVQFWNAVQSRNGRVQVAEQFHRQPLHAARLEGIRRGRIGPAHTAYVSVCHGYHGTSLIRCFLGVAFEEARITG
ncbi:MAG TPA: Gfo/Idh/MocA family oxidoreductase, partial [Chloroflexota bacterium]|nr:Gfo/Idh/MocA family oxidoreductase [Chloroflexota bacterium]